MQIRGTVQVPNAQQTLALIAKADSDMDAAKMLDNGPMDAFQDTGMFVMQDGKGHFSQFTFSGDKQHGSLEKAITRLATHTKVEFDGDKLTIDERKPIDDENWQHVYYFVDRSHPESTTI